MCINILSVFNWGRRIALDGLWRGLGYCVLLCCHHLNQTAFLGLCPILLESPLPLGLPQQEEMAAEP